MKYGETYAQRRKRQTDEDNIKKKTWIKCFALFPAHLSNGSWVWLETYYKRWFYTDLFGIDCYHKELYPNNILGYMTEERPRNNNRYTTIIDNL